MRETVTYNGITVKITTERWEHILLRHPEMEGKEPQVTEAVAEPDEAYQDPEGAIHLLKKTPKGISDYLVVIYVKTNKEGYISTAYPTSTNRKKRRYKWFKKLKPS